MKSTLGELVRLFFKLGCISFGGPAAHIAMMQDEVVEKRKWISRQNFLDLIGATNLIPGPNSTQMTMHVGYLRAGVLGVFAAGSAFIFPAFLITAALAWAYLQYGSLPQVEPFLYGIKPAVLAIIFATVWKLGKTAVKGWRLAVIGGLVIGASMGGFNEVLAILFGALVGMLWLHYSNPSSRSPGTSAAALVATWMAGMAAKEVSATEMTAASVVGGSVAGVSLTKLGLFFLKVGLVLYGSGYVLVAYIEGGLVHDYGWLTQQQLLDAIAIGQLTPGPVLTTATVVGYMVLGLPGAVVATFAIFLPSFFLVALLNPVVPKLRKSPWASNFLDAINVSSVGLMAAVSLELTVSTLESWPAWVIAGAAAGLTLKWKVNALWLVLGGALAGWLLSSWAF